MPTDKVLNAVIVESAAFFVAPFHYFRRRGLKLARHAVVQSAVTLFICAMPFIRAQAAPGDIVPTFGAGGKVTTAITDNQDIAWATSVQPDGKIIVVGYATNPFQSPFGLSAAGAVIIGPSPDTDFALARYNPDGSPDVTFGDDGKVTMDFFGGDDVARAVALRQDGKIVAAGLATSDEISGLGIRATARASLSTARATAATTST